ncbi:MAG: SAM-dependent methyltransferase, partial [Verrucomicrobiales bacterium]|nr:SAM-dependent methyltransferase [Verrucomicrobiales bacterium]
VREALDGATVARLKSGDPAVFGRLDEETEALREAGVPFDVTPGVTAASSAAASFGVSLTRRGRNGAFRLLTGHDVSGFAEQDWRTLARSGSQAAVYMGLRAARFLSGRLLMHGADPQTPVAIAENASRPEEKLFRTTLAALPDALAEQKAEGPSVLLIGIDAPEAVDDERRSARCPAGAAIETGPRSFHDTPSHSLEAAQ